ncbi:hypothetical protein CPL00364_CDS0045 [Klebsiella phage PoeticCupcake]
MLPPVSEGLKQKTPQIPSEGTQGVHKIMKESKSPVKTLAFYWRLYCFHSDLADSRQTIHSSRSDVSGASAHSSYSTRGIDRGNLRIGRRKGHCLYCISRSYRRSQGFRSPNV